MEGDENSTRDAGNFIDAINVIKKRYACCVLVVHHSGKDAARGQRGSSAFKGSADMELSLTVDGDFKRLSTSKPKDIEKQPDTLFKLIQFDTGWTDEDQEPVKSAAMTLYEFGAASKAKSKPVKLAPKVLDVFHVISEELEKRPMECPGIVKVMFPDSPHSAPKFCTTIKNIRIESYKKFVDSSNPRQDLSRAVSSLKTANMIGHHDGFLWIIR